MQRSTDAEVLNIWMDTPKPPVVSVRDASGNTIAEQQDVQDSDTESLHETTPARTAMNPTYKDLDPVPVIRPFLEWLVLDDFGNRDESATDVKVNRFLSTIYQSLSATCASKSAVSASQAAQIPQPGQNSNHRHAAQTEQTTVASQSPQVGPTLQGGSTDQGGQTASLGHASQPGQTSQAGQSPQAAQMLLNEASGIGRPTISVTGRTLRDVDDLIYKLKQQIVGSNTIIEQQLREETAKLFSYFVPTTHNETLAPVRLIWGLLYELIVSSFLFRMMILMLKQSAGASSAPANPLREDSGHQRMGQTTAPWSLSPVSYSQ